VKIGARVPASSVRYAIFADDAPDDDVAIMTVSLAANDRDSAATAKAYGAS
jgi:hypothetical protein